jgi:hypothetical protein
MNSNCITTVIKRNYATKELHLQIYLNAMLGLLYWEYCEIPTLAILFNASSFNSRVVTKW